MSQTAQITLLAQRIRDEFNAHKVIQGALSGLNTTNKTSLVDAINEVLASAGVSIDDLATNSTTTWSSSKINDTITSAITALIGGAGVDDDTLAELANKIAALQLADAGLVSANTVQSFTPAQKLQALDNIGAASEADLTLLEVAVGDTTRNFVTDFETGLV
jgi:hypothetical protein